MSDNSLTAGGGVVSLFPAQVDALRELFTIKDAMGLDVSADTHASLRVSLYCSGNPDDEDAPLPAARWFSVSVAGTIREIAPNPEQVAA